MQVSSKQVVAEHLAGLAIKGKNLKVEDIRPIGDQVLVEADPPETMTDGGLHIPMSAQKRGFVRTGTVVAAGAGEIRFDGTRYPMHVAVGDRVAYDQASNRVLNLDGKEYLFLREEQHCLLVLD